MFQYSLDLPCTYFDAFSCSPGNVKYDVAWGFYFRFSVWDVTTLAISLWYLLRIETPSPLYAFPRCSFSSSHVPTQDIQVYSNVYCSVRLGPRRPLTADHTKALRESLSIIRSKFLRSCTFSMICRRCTPNLNTGLSEAEYLPTPS